MVSINTCVIMVEFHGHDQEVSETSQAFKNCADFRIRFAAEVPPMAQGGPRYAVYNCSRRLSPNYMNHTNFDASPTLTTQSRYLFVYPNVDAPHSKVPAEGRFMYWEERANIVGVLPSTLRSNTTAQNVMSLGNGMSVNVIGVVLNQIFLSWSKWLDSAESLAFNLSLHALLFKRPASSVPSSKRKRIRASIEHVPALV